MLKLSALTKRYNTGDLALNKVDLEIPDAQVMALIGPSGAGKSTLIRCVNRLWSQWSSCVLLSMSRLGHANQAGVNIHNQGHRCSSCSRIWTRFSSLVVWPATWCRQRFCMAASRLNRLPPAHAQLARAHAQTCLPPGAACRHEEPTAHRRRGFTSKRPECRRQTRSDR